MEASHASLAPPRPIAPQADANWRTILAQAVRDPIELCRRLELPESLAAEAARSTAGFGVLVPEPYLARIRHGDPLDPLLLQVLPRKEELAECCSSWPIRYTKQGPAARPVFWESIKAGS